MMVFSGVASQCEERGAMPARTNFEIAATMSSRRSRAGSASGSPLSAARPGSRNPSSSRTRSSSFAKARRQHAEHRP